MKMDMSGANGILSVPSEHLPGLIALVLFPVLAWLVVWGVGRLARAEVPWAVKLVDRIRSLSVLGKATLGAVGIGAIVHLAIVPTHWGDERVTALLFIADTVGFVAVGVWMLSGRPHWRAAAVTMLVGTAAFYVLYLLTGWETADLVGLLTTTIELGAGLALLVPISVAATTTRQRWSVAGAVPLALVVLLGTTAIANGATSDATASASTGHTPSSSQSMANMPGMSMPSSAKPLSLQTESPAGAITWPDAMPANMTGMDMVTPNCTAQPTSAQQQAAVSLVDATTAAVAPYKSLAAAKAAGYVPVTPTGKRVVHYINYSIARQGTTLDPSAIPVLVYVNTNHGAVLSAAMYLSLGAESASPPQPGGCLTEWHTHSDLCFKGAAVVGTDNEATCNDGSVNKKTMPMMHVWVTPVPGGPLSPDPSGISEVVAAAHMPSLATPNGIA